MIKLLHRKICSPTNILRFVLFACALWLGTSVRSFNYEIEKRIRERLNSFLGGPVDAAKVIAAYRANDGFPNSMTAVDRDKFLPLAFSIRTPLVYFGLEDGTCAGYYWSYGYYREPGNAGYDVNNARMQKHFNSCIDGETGVARQCMLEPGSSYVSCRGGEGDETGLCDQIAPCPGQTSCEPDDLNCDSSFKWCRQYDILQTPDEGIPKGYIPLTNFCINGKGQFSQEPGTTIDPNSDVRDTLERTSCRFGSGQLVQRNVTGNFAACENGTCSSVFAGGYTSSEYDPRYRPWYINTRKLQKPNWTPPFPFFTLGIGITYAEPIYSTDENSGLQHFAGVIAVDYRFEDIARFLVDSYGESDTAVLIYEVAGPEHYVVASSTGSPASLLRLSADLSLPCPVQSGDRTGCEPVRIKVENFGGGHHLDPILVKAALAHAEANYPQTLLTVTATDEVDSPTYVTQSTFYSQRGTDLDWYVVVVAPATRNTTDALVAGNPYTLVLIVIGVLGVIICCMFALAMYRRRTEKAIVFADWRFTCAFILGCALLNISSFTLLGENTEVTCLLRMWSFHLSFVIALSPLFVKVWRMYKLVGSENIRRNTITNRQAAIYTLPMIVPQALLLLIFSFVNKPQPVAYVVENGGEVIYGAVCGSDTRATIITLGFYEASFVVVGCVLAYWTRNMQDDFGEAKQMIFSMYNIFFVGLVALIVMSFISLGRTEESMLQAMGVFWGTTVSAGAFAIPRLLQAQNFRKEIREGRLSRNNNVHITGVGSNSQKQSGNRKEYDSNLMSSVDVSLYEAAEEEMANFSTGEKSLTQTTEHAPFLPTTDSTPPAPRSLRVGFAGTVGDDDDDNDSSSTPP